MHRSPFTKDFLSQIEYRIDESLRFIERCFDQLSQEQCWQKPNSEMNTIGNLILHLCGNIRQYAISSLGQQTDSRDRDAEFAHVSTMTKSELIQKIQDTVSEAKQIMKTVSEEELGRERVVQGFTMSGIGILIHITEHLSYHTGQIAWMTKFYQEKDLGFYDGFDLNLKN